MIFGRSSLTGLDLYSVGRGSLDGFLIEGAAPHDNAGSAVAPAGDVNGDGTAEVIIGADQAEAADTDNNSGSAYVVYGRADGSTTIDLAKIGQAGNTDGFRIDGAAAHDSAGYAVGGAGDINGDGRPDVIVGAPCVYNDNGRANSGSAYGVFGFGTPQLTYSPNSIAGMVNTPIEPLTPSVKRTGTARFSVSPSLPAGLALNPDTGTISGTPTAKQPARTCTVTMTDLAGQATASVSIRIDLPPRKPRVIEALGGD